MQLNNLGYGEHLAHVGNGIINQIICLASRPLRYIGDLVFRGQWHANPILDTRIVAIIGFSTKPFRVILKLLWNSREHSSNVLVYCFFRPNLGICSQKCTSYVCSEAQLLAMLVVLLGRDSLETMTEG